MAEFVNLRTARKRKARDEKAKTAEQNRAKFGQSKAERQAKALSLRLDAAKLDGHKRGDD